MTRAGLSALPLHGTAHLALRRTHLGPDDPMVAESTSNLGSLMRLMGRYEEAETLLREALTRYRAHYDEETWR